MLSLNKFEKIEIILFHFLTQGMKLEINYRKKTGIKQKHVETNQHATRNPMIIKKKIKNTLRQVKIEM